MYIHVSVKLRRGTYIYLRYEYAFVGFVQRVAMVTINPSTERDSEALAWLRHKGQLLTIIVIPRISTLFSLPYTHTCIYIEIHVHSIICIVTGSIMYIEIHVTGSVSTWRPVGGGSCRTNMDRGSGVVLSSRMA